MTLFQHKDSLKSEYKKQQQFFKHLKKVKPRVLDNFMHTFHQEVFEYTNCLECANCCKTTGPLFTDKDIQRLAKHFGIKQFDFIDQYLRIDEDGDYVLKSVPCTFLAEDNHCSIYNVRPKACREYPHTNRKKQYQLLDITQRNISVCPAVSDVVEKLKKELVK